MLEKISVALGIAVLFLQCQVMRARIAGVRAHLLFVRLQSKYLKWKIGQ